MSPHGGEIVAKEELDSVRESVAGDSHVLPPSVGSGAGERIAIAVVVSVEQREAHCPAD